MITQKRQKRKLRMKNKVLGRADRPRISVFRSNKFIYAQAIDDANAKTLASVSQKEFEKEKGTKSEKATLVGEKIAKMLLSQKIKKVAFDRSGFAYHGRVKAVAEGARKGGLEF